MDKIIKADLPIRREEVTREEARSVRLLTLTDHLSKIQVVFYPDFPSISALLSDASIVLLLAVELASKP